MVGLPEQNPTHVCPKRTIARRMRVTRLIRFLMMNPMGGDPEYGPAFEIQRSANGEEVLHPLWALVGAMGVEPVVSHADAEPGRHPIEHDRREEYLPREHEECCNGACV